MISQCFFIFATLYASCASRRDGLSFCFALEEEDRLLAFVSGQGLMQDYLRACIPVFCQSVERTHLLTALEYTLYSMLKKATNDTEIRALTLARRLFEGLDLQRHSHSPIPHFITSLAYFELDAEEMKQLLYLVTDDPSKGTIASIQS